MTVKSLLPAIGVAVAIRRAGKILLGLRPKNARHSPDTWGFPGGNLEYGEMLVEGAFRENDEESGVKIRKVRFWTFSEDIYPDENKHYLTMLYTADWVSGEGAGQMRPMGMVPVG